jgi:hypothetical protein
MSRHMMAQYSLHVCLQLVLTFLCLNFLPTRKEKHDFARKRRVDVVEKVVHQDRMGDNAGLVRTGHSSDIQPLVSGKRYREG